MAQKQEKLYRSRVHRIFLGVCGGIAEYVNTDSVLIRLIFILLALFNGIGVLIYIVAAIFMPENPTQKAAVKSGENESEHKSLIIGAVLVVLGLSLFFHQFFDFIYFRWPFWWFHHVRWQFVYPTLIILIGVVLVIRSLQKQEDKQAAATKKDEKGLYRSKSDRLIAGVCSGIAQSMNIDVTLVRIGWVVLTLLTHIIVGVSAYILFVLFVPEKNDKKAVQTGKSKPKKSEES